MKAKDCLLYSKDKFKTTVDAWSHIDLVLSYSRYYPDGYEPKVSIKKDRADEVNVAKNWVLEMEELFEEFKKYGFLFKNEKDNWEFEKLSIEDGLARIG